MSFLLDALAWIADPAHWPGPDGILARGGEHVRLCLLVLALACAIALPIGLAIGHTGRARGLAIAAAGALRALPTLGLLLLFALMMSIGPLPAVAALVILALPPVLAGAYSGIESVDRATVDAARAVGMTGWQVLWRVEVPLALPLVLGGIRSAALQVVATWTVAAILPVGGLGRYIFDALPLQQYAKMLAGSLLVIALALLADGVFALLQRLVVPRGVVAGIVAPVV